MRLDLSLREIEVNLDIGALKAPTTKGTLWIVRRNGKTRRWKREPERFSIPVKIGFRSFAYITNETSFATDSSADFRVML